MILVTGGTGLVGTHLLLHLAESGQQVRALYRTRESIGKTKKLFAHYGKLPLLDTIEWVEGDLLDIPSLEEAFKGVDYVYHCAAHISFEPKDEGLLRKINIEGTANMVNCSLDFSIKKFCHVSSIAALGDSRDGSPITEETEWNPEKKHSDYAITKYGAEMEVWRAWQEGLNVVIVNPGIIFGAGFWDNGSGKIFKAIKRGQYFYTKGTCGIVAVEDVVNFMVALMESDYNGERYSLVAQNLTYKEILDTIAEGMGKNKPSIYASRPLTSFAWRMDWLLSKLLMRKRVLTRDMARSSHNRDVFDNSKSLTVHGFRHRDPVFYLRRLAEDYRAS
jgi:dihydroflavonol-4-reductase